METTYKRFHVSIILSTLFSFSLLLGVAHRGEAKARVFVGGADDISLIADFLKDAGGSYPLGLYEHANGMALISQAQRVALQKHDPGLLRAAVKCFDTMGEIAELASYEPGYTAYFGGRLPCETNINVSANGSFTSPALDGGPGAHFGHYMSQENLQEVRSALQAARHAGSASTAIIVAPNGGDEDLAGDFAIAPFWSNFRKAIVVSGGVAVDAPPSYALARGPSYLKVIEQIIRWTHYEHLRSTFIVSPFGPDARSGQQNCNTDNDLLKNTMRIVSELQRANALPESWIVERYCNIGVTEDRAKIDTLYRPLLTVAKWLVIHSDEQHVR